MEGGGRPARISDHRSIVSTTFGPTFEFDFRTAQEIGTADIQQLFSSGAFCTV